MTEIKAVEYYPSNKGLKNIYSYTNDIREKVINSYIEDGEDKETAQFIVDYFEYIYGKREEREEE